MAKKMNAYKRASIKLQKEADRQCHLIYGAACLAFYREWGWKTERIRRILDVSSVVCNECASDNSVSMVEMLEKETGIEIQNGNGLSWHDLPYLNVKKTPETMTAAQLVYMRLRQIEWMAPNIAACLLLALHRKYGFGYERCMRVYQQIREIEEEFGMDPKRIRRAVLEETGINIIEKLSEKPKKQEHPEE